MIKNINLVKNKPVTITGYFVNYDIYNRAKLMFLDDYDDYADGDNDKINSLSFTKSYMIAKNRILPGISPIVDDEKYMIIKCPKNCIAYLPDTIENKFKIKLVPINELLQHKVTCDVVVSKYKFTKNNCIIEGWNIKLIKMTMLEY